jgi:hypothetical protein
MPPPIVGGGGKGSRSAAAAAAAPPPAAAAAAPPASGPTRAQMATLQDMVAKVVVKHGLAAILDKPITAATWTGAVNVRWQ